MALGWLYFVCYIFKFSEHPFTPGTMLGIRMNKTAPVQKKISMTGETDVNDANWDMQIAKKN